MFKRKEKGFTLIELLIVIAVIGILAAAILPRFIAFDTDAKISSTKGSLSSLRTAIVLHRSKEEAFPALLADLVGTYIDKIPEAQYHVRSTGVVTSEDDAGGWFYTASTGVLLINSTATDTNATPLNQI
jgi:prepilin-type N-terminal cleavage/methylation domain-containing protein